MDPDMNNQAVMNPQVMQMIQALAQQPGMVGGMSPNLAALGGQDPLMVNQQQPALGAEFMPQGMLGQNVPPTAPGMTPPPDSPY
jgi:hypothetical protein